MHVFSNNMGKTYARIGIQLAREKDIVHITHLFRYPD